MADKVSVSIRLSVGSDQHKAELAVSPEFPEKEKFFKAVESCMPQVLTVQTNSLAFLQRPTEQPIDPWRKYHQFCRRVLLAHLANYGQSSHEYSFFVSLRETERLSCAFGARVV